MKRALFAIFRVLIVFMSASASNKKLIPGIAQREIFSTILDVLTALILLINYKKSKVHIFARILVMDVSMLYVKNVTQIL